MNSFMILFGVIANIIMLLFVIKEIISFYQTYKRGIRLGAEHKKQGLKYDRKKLFQIAFEDNIDPERPNLLWHGYRKSNP